MRTVESDAVDRVAKLLVDAGDAPTFEAAADLLRTYRMQLVVDAAACADPAWQAALLTAVNAGRRAVHGGVLVAIAADPPCTVPIARGEQLSKALTDFGAQIVAEPAPAVPTLVFGGAVVDRGRAPVIYATAGRWIARVSPDGPTVAGRPEVPAAVLAAALGVSEMFQWLRGRAVAGDRDVAVSLWDPGASRTAEGPALSDLPDGLWLLGLGHLGQAYAWLLSLLPYPEEGERPLALQDDDRLSAANRATSMLHRDGLTRVRKPRLVAGVMDELGWDTRLLEHRYTGGRLHQPGDPAVLLVGVDNPDARQALDETGFGVIYDAGLGAGPDGYLSMMIRRLPAARPSRELWRERPRAAPGPRAAAYDMLAETTGDRCGVELLADSTVATAFVGVAAACWVIGGVLRELHGGRRLELVDYSLRDPASVTAIAAADARPARIASVPCAR